MPGLARLAFQPASLAGLKIDMDPTLGVTSAAGAVSAWANQGYQSNSANQATAGLKPLLVASVLNGWPGIRFDGVDDSLQYVTAISDILATIFFVVTGAAVITTTTNASFFALDKLALLLNEPNNAAGWGCYANVNVASGVVLDNAGHVLSNVSRASNDQDLVTDGVLVNRTNGVSYPTRAGSAIGANVGGGLPTALTVHRILMYDRALAVNDRKAVEQYLSKRYGVAVAA